jgi:hypothetical protein
MKQRTQEGVTPSAAAAVVRTSPGFVRLSSEGATQPTSRQAVQSTLVLYDLGRAYTFSPGNVRVFPVFCVNFVSYLVR